MATWTPISIYRAYFQTKTYHQEGGPQPQRMEHARLLLPTYSGEGKMLQHSSVTLDLRSRMSHLLKD
jgi:hypothetical protein